VPALWFKLIISLVDHRQIEMVFNYRFLGRNYLSNISTDVLQSQLWNRTIMVIMASAGPPSEQNRTSYGPHVATSTIHKLPNPGTDGPVQISLSVGRAFVWR
jgi:hypothetical protein